MKRRIDKFHVSQIIRHTESHNRAKEEQYMWLHRREDRRKYEEKSRGYSKPEDRSSKRAKFSYDLEEKSARKVGGPEDDVSRWGHEGYWELYPCGLSPRVEKEKSRDRHELKSERKGTIKKKKHRRDRRPKKAKRKEKRSESDLPASELEISAESELDDASNRKTASNQQSV